MSANLLTRIAEALERMAPAASPMPDWGQADAFVWHTGPDRLQPVAKVNRVPIGLLVGVDRARDILLENTRQFANGQAANNVLLWGSRGMGKSSLVKAAHAEVLNLAPVKLIEIVREDLPTIGRLMNHLREADARFLLFCDDLSFDQDTARISR